MLHSHSDICTICITFNYVDSINVYPDIISFLKILSSSRTEKSSKWTEKSVVQNTVSDFVPGFQWQLYVCLACVAAIAGPKHINCRKAISLVRLCGVINVLRTVVYTAFNHTTRNYFRTPNKILYKFERCEGVSKTGPIFIFVLNITRYCLNTQR